MATLNLEEAGHGTSPMTISSMGGYSQWLIAHELGHQWWGNLVTCNSFEHIWLNEGFARFSEALWEEEHNGFFKHTKVIGLITLIMDQELYMLRILVM